MSECGAVSSRPLKVGWLEFNVLFSRSTAISETIATHKRQFLERSAWVSLHVVRVRYHCDYLDIKCSVDMSRDVWLYRWALNDAVTLGLSSVHANLMHNDHKSPAIDSNMTDRDATGPTSVEKDLRVSIEVTFHYAIQVADLVSDLSQTRSSYLEISRQVDLLSTERKSQAGRRPSRTCPKLVRKSGLRPG